MLKAIIGVDTVEHAESILRLLARIHFEPIVVELLHVVDSALPLVPSGAFSGPELIGEYSDALRVMGEQSLKASRAVACDLGLTTRSTLVFGPPALTLLDYAKENKVDLIGVRSTHAGPFSSFIYGSTSRALAIGAAQSVLIAKRDASRGGIRAVLAVDHSDYCNRCIERLIAMRPQGLKKVCVLTAVYDQAHDPGLPTQLEEKSSAIVERLAAAGIEAEPRVVHGHPNVVIRLTMHDFGAELAILGAYGHSFIERLMVGSVSLHQVVAEDYSALLIRA